MKYEEVAGRYAVYFSRDPATLEGVWWYTRGTSLWLYDDSAASRFTYFERLQKLMLRQMAMVA